MGDPAGGDHRFCYVVMGHTDPEGVARSLRAIRRLSPDAALVLRHSVPDLVGDDVLAEVGATRWVSEQQVVWGDWSMTCAVLEVLAHVRDAVDADHVVLVSGQDHPVRHLAAWERQVRESGADALLDVFPPMPDDWAYRWWPVTVPSVGPRLARRVVKAGWRRLAGPARPAVMFYRGRRDPRWTLGVRRPELLRGEPPTPVLKGSLWMTLSRRALVSALARHEVDGQARAFFERVRIPDESYLQSLLLADPDLRIVDCPTSYARFAYDEWSPRWLDLAELARAAQTPAAFARKVPAGCDQAVVDEMERLAARPESEAPPVRDFQVGEPKLTGAERAPGVLPRTVPLPARRR